MPTGTGNTKVPHMSVTSAGASPYPAALPSWSGQSGDGQVSKTNGQNANNGANDATGNGATTNNTNPLPVQAATSPGTAQKVNVIA
jgi:hypothetical protein